MKLDVPLQCTQCYSLLVYDSQLLNCDKCHSRICTDVNGYFSFTGKNYNNTSDDYAHIQNISGSDMYNRFLKKYLPNISENPKILEIGCGTGQLTRQLLENGYEAYGIDLGNLTHHWKNNGNPNGHFFISDATCMPFIDSFFDFIYLFGVIEHIGTIDGNCTLENNFLSTRKRLVQEIVRILKWNGSIIISCPNRNFPIDIQHGPVDKYSEKSFVKTFRSYIFSKTRLNFHKPYGEQFLLNTKDIKNLFSDYNVTIENLNITDFFGFTRFNKNRFLKILKSIVKIYIKMIPRILRGTFINPYLLVKIKKN